MGIISGVGSSASVGPTSGGKVYGYSTLTVLQNVAPTNPSRRTLSFHNPGTVDILVGPALAFSTAAGTTPSALTPTTSVYGGCYRVFANGGDRVITGECQGAWQALTIDATNGQLTVMDSNV